MIYLYYYANKLNLLVCGTSDKSETMMGYFTKWGDMASDISPIMDLYKTQVRRLAEYLGIPKEIVNKPASPMLWPGQLAIEELGMDYEIINTEIASAILIMVIVTTLITPPALVRVLRK